MRLYVAGPMRGYDRWNFPAFRAATAALRAEGHDVTSPHELDEAIGFTEDTVDLPEGFLTAAMRRDIEALLQVEAVVLLPGWEDSVGTRFELSVAKWLGLEVYEVRLLSEPRLVPLLWGQVDALLAATA